MPASGTCYWRVISEGGWYGGTAASPYDLWEDLQVLAMYDGSGNYCGRVSDHVCATPQNADYYGGLTIQNWWYADGVYQNSRVDRFYPSSGQTVCSYSGSYLASHSTVIDGEFATWNGVQVGLHSIGGTP
ncbi:hypothetical protein ACWEO4_42610 [Streptomyces sp. NPDC004393]|uniref:hypothetical protein n=1 Tax=unclassified Streptomyces TaxID=2593676 RepID=UPI0033B4B7C8